MKSNRQSSRRPLRVALIANSDTPGGAETYLYRLYSGLQQRGLVNVTLIGELPNWPAGVGKTSAVGCAPKLTRQSPLAPQLKNTLANAFAVRKFISENDFDVVHMQYFREKLILPGFFVTNLPTVWTEHGPLPPNFPRAGIPLLRWKARRSTIMAVSDAVRASLQEVNIPSHVVWNPLPKASTTRRNDGESSDYVLYAGRVHSQKRIELLLQAAQLVPNLVVKIAGDGPDLAQLRRAAPENVEFLGHLADLHDLMSGCLALVSTSGVAAREGSPMVVLEARRQGVPVLMAEDCHAAGEARSLGAHIYSPEAEDLAKALTSLGCKIRTEPLEPDVEETRGEEKWLDSAYDFLLRAAHQNNVG